MKYLSCYILAIHAENNEISRISFKLVYSLYFVFVFDVKSRVREITTLLWKVDLTVSGPSSPKHKQASYCNTLTNYCYDDKSFISYIGYLMYRFMLDRCPVRENFRLYKMNYVLLYSNDR